MEMGDNRLPRNNGEYHHHSVNGTSPKMKQEAQWKLYEAYNEFHSLAQKSSIPFHAPAVLVVGHQTEGKSALIEALTGFQFNHVGEGTKTRRPITIHMKFNPDCGSPLYYLYSDSDPSIHHEKTLEQIQEYIEAENMSLENEPYQFSSKEIIIRIEYKYCPNLTIIDTPGLVAPALARKNLALQNQAWALESFLREKMKHKEFIIMCLKDCSDWSNTTAQRIVMQIDPELSRTVVVSTKLDTKIPKFARASDAEVFLSPPSRTRGRFMLGDSPFFTSVPSGRVGLGHESVFESNDEFKQAVSSRESDDLKALEEKLGRSLSERERSRIGVSSLKSFLEELLQRRYMDSVPSIIPLLEKEYRSINKKLNKIRQEHSTLDGAKLKEKGRSFTNLFLTKLSLLLKGTVVAPPDKFGETLQDERVNGGAFTGTDGLQFPQKLIPNAGIRLYGGAQYHRAMAEFRFVVGRIECPPITREEMVNACGVEDIHDGTNNSRTACVIAVSKALDTFEPFLHQLGGRLLHILKRLLPISVFLLQRDGEYLRSYEVFLKRAASAFNKFAESTEKSCREKCMEDLTSTTRYVSWSLHNKNQAGLRQFLDSFGGVKLNELAMGNDSNGGVPRTDSRLTDLVDGTLLNRRLRPSSERIDYALARKFFHGIKEYFLGSGANEKQESKSEVEVKLNKLALGNDSNGGMPTTETKVAGLLDSTLWNRSLEPSSERMVNALVRQIFHGIREYFLTSAEMKFNCFLLMPVVDKLPAILHEDLGFPFEDDDSVFDIACFPHLSTEEQETEIELEQIQRLKEKFQRIHYSIRPC